MSLSRLTQTICPEDSSPELVEVCPLSMVLLQGTGCRLSWLLARVSFRFSLLVQESCQVYEKLGSTIPTTLPIMSRWRLLYRACSKLLHLNTYSVHIILRQSIMTNIFEVLLKFCWGHFFVEAFMIFWWLPESLIHNFIHRGTIATATVKSQLWITHESLGVTYHIPLRQLSTVISEKTFSPIIYDKALNHLLRIRYVIPYEK